MVAPGLVQESGLEESCEPRVGAVPPGRVLVRPVEVLPVTARFEILFHVGGLFEPRSNLGDAKIVVCVFQCAGDAARHGAEALVVEVLDWDVA